jgi:hypothetical protein
MLNASRSLACSFLLLVPTSCNNGGGGGGVGLIDRGACDLLIDCASTLAPETRDELIATYGQGGACWQGGPQQWAACRDACRASLDALNLVAQATGETCGTCQTDADCAEYGIGAVCDAGLCLGGGGMSDGETGDSSSSGDGDGDGDGPVVPIEAVSILLVVDNSGSMSRPQRTLATRAGELVAPLDAAGIPWRLGITTTDNGNSWCDTGITTPEAGELVFSSCRSRINDFLFNNGAVDSQDFLCQDFCSTNDISTIPTTTASDPTPTSRPWIESSGGQTNLANGVALQEALDCTIPQGINGCGFESQLDSTRLAIARASSNVEDSYGFVEPGRLLVVVFLTDETDCSDNPNWDAIFEVGGGKTFWSDPSSMYPTSAVCWNAGMNCIGDPSNYDSCSPVNLDINGAPTDNPDNAVLLPVDGVIDDIGAAGPVLVFGIVGVDASGEPFYADVTNTDPDYQLNFGIGPSCSGVTSFGPEQAVPPGRIWTVLEALGPENSRAAWSICAEDFDDGLAEIGDAIAARF